MPVIASVIVNCQYMYQYNALKKNAGLAKNGNLTLTDTCRIEARHFLRACIVHLHVVVFINS